MLVDVALASLVAVAVLVLVRAIRAGERGREMLFKTVASAGFVTLGCWRRVPGDAVGAWLVAGLVLCAAGDICLLGDRTFDLGLLTFLLGHLAYVGGFRAALPLSSWPAPVLVPLVLAGAIAASWLWPWLGPRRLPVLLYIVAISVMLWEPFRRRSGGRCPGPRVPARCCSICRISPSPGTVSSRAPS